MTDAPAHRTFSPTDAALEGFRIARERPRMLLVWAVFYFLTTLVTAVLLVTFAGDTLMEMRAAEEAGQADPAIAMQFLSRLAPLSLLGLVFTTIFATAVCRVVLRPGDDRFAYLRLGGDELRLILVTLLFIAFWIALTFVVVLVASILMGILAMVVTMASEGAGIAFVTVVTALISLAMIPAFFALWVKLSLAWPMTFAERRIRFLQSWKLTRGNFWRLFGAYLLAIILAVLVLALGMVVFAGIAAIVTGGDLAAVGQVFRPDTTSLGSYFTVPMIIYTLCAGLLGALQYLIMFAPAAVAYRELVQGRADDFS